MVLQNVKRIDPRPNISEELANTLREMIFEGELADGERINEVQLSARLGVSRTPLREALSMLVAEEALVSIPRRGFFVRELTIDEFENIYPMRSFLDPEALKLAGIPTEEQFKKLEGIDKKKRATKDYKTRALLDDEWNMALIENCKNQVLTGQIKLFMNRIRRYGLAFHKDRQVIKISTTEHQNILKALKKGNMESACEWLKKNLRSDTTPILNWLKGRK